MLPNIEYERGDRQYRVTDPNTGVVEFFPGGWDGKRRAQRQAICFHNARLHRLVQNMTHQWPTLEARAWRAAELIVTDGVTPVADGETVAMVRSKSGYGDYLIKSQNGRWSCDCIDFIDGQAPYVGPSGQRLCKHILAVKLTQRLAYRHCHSCGAKVDADLMRCSHCGGPTELF